MVSNTKFFDDIRIIFKCVLILGNYNPIRFGNRTGMDKECTIV